MPPAPPPHQPRGEQGSRWNRDRFRLRRNYQCIGQVQCTGVWRSQYIPYWLELPGPSPSIWFNSPSPLLHVGHDHSRSRMGSDFGLIPQYLWGMSIHSRLPMWGMTIDTRIFVLYLRVRVLFSHMGVFYACYLVRILLPGTYTVRYSFPTINTFWRIAVYSLSPMGNYYILRSTSIRSPYTSTTGKHTLTLVNKYRHDM